MNFMVVRSIIWSPLFMSAQICHTQEQSVLDNSDNRIDQHTGVHSWTRTPARSERHSEVRSECDGVRRRRVYRPTETDWQVCLDEVSFE
jgi:hypothetical protein